MVAKLIVFPLITLLFIRWLNPAASRDAMGVAVILSGTPSAVAMYVISGQLGVERGFVSSLLVLSTALSVFTLPVWVYVVKGM